MRQKRPKHCKNSLLTLQTWWQRVAKVSHLSIVFPLYIRHIIMTIFLVTNVFMHESCTLVHISHTLRSHLSLLNVTMKYCCPYPQCKSRLVVANKHPVELLVRASAASEEALKVQKAALNFVNSKDVSEQASDEKAIEEKPEKSETDDSEFFLPFYDPFDFDNISVTKPVFEAGQEPSLVSSDGKTTVSIERLLACAECDRGPFGVIGKVSNVGTHEGLTHDKNVYLLRPESVVATES